MVPISQTELAAKGYIIVQEAWYAEFAIKSGPSYAQVLVGIFDKNDDLKGDVLFSWETYEMTLKIFQSSWRILERMPELMRVLEKYSRQNVMPTVTEFTGNLRQIGYEDFTERERPQKKKKIYI